MRLTLSLALFLSLSASFSLGQRRSALPSALVGSTWQLYYRLNSADRWDDYGQLRFLQDGVVEEITPSTGYRCRGGKWKVVRQKLQIVSRPYVDSPFNCAPSLVNGLNAQITGSTITGTGALGMNPRGFQVRLVKIATPSSSQSND